MPTNQIAADPVACQGAIVQSYQKPSIFGLGIPSPVPLQLIDLTDAELAIVVATLDPGRLLDAEPL